MYSTFSENKNIQGDFFNLKIFTIDNGYTAVNEYELARFNYYNILNDLSIYDFTDEIMVLAVKRIMQNRIEAVGIESGFLGVDSELLYVGFLNFNQNHKILTRNNSLEHADFGTDIISLDENMVVLNEVKSSVTNTKNINNKLIKSALKSIFKTDSRMNDQLVGINKILDSSQFNELQVQIIRETIRSSIEYEDGFSKFKSDKFINKEIKINILLISKVVLNSEEVFKYISGNIDLSDYIENFDSNSDLVICVYHIKLTDSFDYRQYYQELIEVIKADE